MADSTLTAIRTKVRRLTRSPSTSQITDADIDEYVNTFILYDFPEHLRLSYLRSTFTFFTEPNIDLYENSTVVGNQFENFKNLYVTTHKPAYIAGYPTSFSQSREEFFSLYPRTNSIVNEATGDGATTNFTGTLTNIPVLRNNVLFSSIDANNNGLSVYDSGDGTFAGNGNGTINYVTGVYDITFNTAPGNGEEVNSQTVPYVAARPQSLLYFENKIWLRPVPDQPYRVEFEVYKRPTELLAGNSPDLEQWWQYIAYGAAKKVFEDRTDLEGVAMLMPEFKQQERLVLRKTIVQQSKERVATIYTDRVPTGYNGWGNYNDIS